MTAGPEREPEPGPLEPPVLVSACLLGLNTRYNAVPVENEDMLRLARERRILPLCPEQLGGLPTPREPASIVGGGGEDVLDGRARVVTASGRDVTEAFLRGAQETARLARLAGVRRAYLKSRSPSCGAGELRNLAGGLDVGDGVTAALLGRMGIEVVACEAVPRRAAALEGLRALPRVGRVGNESP